MSPNADRKQERVVVILPVQYSAIAILGARPIAIELLGVDPADFCSIMQSL